MRILLDACVPERFARFLPEHDVVTDRRYFGTTDVNDGPILDRIPDGIFEAFVAVDKNLRYQQNLRDRAFRILLLRAPSNALEFLVPLVPQLLMALAETRPGDLRIVGV